MRYEYKQLRAYGGPGTRYYQTGDFLSFREGIAKTEVTLDKLGSDGWMMVALIKDGGSSAWYSAVFVRERKGYN